MAFVFGDVHSNVEILKILVNEFGGENLISVGDLLDGSFGAVGSAECVKLCREAGVRLVVGNHEAYPLYANSDKELVELWGEEWGSETGSRIVAEWNAIKALLSDADMGYLYNGKLFLQGENYIVAHAKVVSDLDVSELEVGKLTKKQISFFDHTEDWDQVIDYNGRYGQLYIGHTRWNKVGRRHDWGNVTLLDFNCKKGEAVGVACTDTGQVWSVSLDGEVKII